jgi:Uma2 family endonuclease
MIETKRMTIAEFDAWVETADESFTYELHDGVVYGFSTGTATHGRLCNRIGIWLNKQVEPPPCEVFLGSLSVRRRPDRASSVIPDALVTCEQPPSGQIYVTSPKLVVEVISPTSVVNDLLRKPRVYNAVPSIQEYLVIESRSAWARVFRRDDEGELSAAGEGVTAPDGMLELQTVGLSFTLDDLYRGIL